MKVRELLTDESKWTRRTFARTADGTPCRCTNKEATCFCLMGAIFRCYADSSESELQEIGKRVQAEIGRFPMTVWNDFPERTFEEVRKLVEKLDI